MVGALEYREHSCGGQVVVYGRFTKTFAQKAPITKPTGFHAFDLKPLAHFEGDLVLLVPKLVSNLLLKKLP